jgi:hypothetical protein
MSRSGQRQDVAFLALAVAVLAIAVALFVGIRALSSRGTAKPASPPQQLAAQEPAKVQPPGSSKRDPFKGKTLLDQAAGTKPKPGEQLKLVGIVKGQGQELLAAIRRGNNRYYAKRGDQVGGYVVAEIGDDRVVLTKGEERLALSLRHHAEAGPKER